MLAMNRILLLIPAATLLLLFSTPSNGALAQQQQRSEQLQLLLEQQLNIGPSIFKDVVLQCNANNMRLLLNITAPFSGRIYPLGLAKKTSCVLELRDSDPVSSMNYTVPLDSAACGTKLTTATDRQGSSEATNTIVVQPHDKLVTSMARAYEIRCMYDYAGRTLASNVSVSMLSAERFTAQAPTPAAALELFRVVKENDSRLELADFVNVGDVLEMRIQMGGNALEYYGLVVGNCRVFDGGMGMDQQQLIDVNGCALFPTIFPAFVYERNRTQAATIFKAHKFPLTSSVGYECDVDFCLRANGECEAIEAQRRCGVEGGAIPTAAGAVVGGRGDRDRVSPAQRMARRTAITSAAAAAGAANPTAAATSFNGANGGVGALGVNHTNTNTNNGTEVGVNSSIPVRFVTTPPRNDTNGGNASAPPLLTAVGTPLKFTLGNGNSTVDNAAANVDAGKSAAAAVGLTVDDVVARLQALGNSTEERREALTALGMNSSDIELLLSTASMLTTPTAASSLSTATEEMQHQVQVAPVGELAKTSGRDETLITIRVPNTDAAASATAPQPPAAAGIEISINNTSNNSSTFAPTSVSTTAEPTLTVEIINSAGTMAQTTAAAAATNINKHARRRRDAVRGVSNEMQQQQQLPTTTTLPVLPPSLFRQIAVPAERRVRIKNFLTVLGEQEQQQQPIYLQHTDEDFPSLLSLQPAASAAAAARPRKQRLSTHTLGMGNNNHRRTMTTNIDTADNNNEDTTLQPIDSFKLQQQQYNGRGSAVADRQDEDDKNAAASSLMAEYEENATNAAMRDMDAAAAIAAALLLVTTHQPPPAIINIKPAENFSALPLPNNNNNGGSSCMSTSVLVGVVIICGAIAVASLVLVASMAVYVARRALRKVSAVAKSPVDSPSTCSSSSSAEGSSSCRSSLNNNKHTLLSNREHLMSMYHGNGGNAAVIGVDNASFSSSKV